MGSSRTITVPYGPLDVLAGALLAADAATRESGQWIVRASFLAEAHGRQLVAGARSGDGGYRVVVGERDSGVTRALLDIRVPIGGGSVSASVLDGGEMGSRLTVRQALDAILSALESGA